MTHERRSRIGVIVDVLAAIDSGLSIPTPIMYRSNTSWRVCDEILGSLAERRLIACDYVPGYAILHRTNIRLTVRGRDVLTEYRRIESELAPGEMVAWYGETR